MNDSDVVGRWKITKQSLDLLARDGFRPEPTQTCIITFSKEGSCGFQTVEEFAKKANYVSANGSWKLEHDIKRGENAAVKNVVQLELAVNGGTEFRHLGFTRQDGKLLLWEFYGDPDEWEFIEYAREN